MKNRLLWIGIPIIILGAIAYFILKANGSKAPEFQFATITRGSVKNTVSSTGTLNAVGTVSVGTQVSGTISSVLVDFNDKVKKGQTLAILDTTVLASAVRDAEANLVRAEAQFKQAEAELQRDAPLYEKGFLSGLEFLPIQTNVEVTKAGLESAQATLGRARTNASYSIIDSPIDGSVIERNIDAGQTVAASFSTPTLFTIAKDLSRMQIFAAVDESDIGTIRLGQKVTFTVQSYAEEIFTGVVQQIRLKPVTIQNVVSYTVVIDAPNEKGILLPGMTATIDFILSEVTDVLSVSNIALHYEPTPAEQTQYGSQQVKDFATGKSKGHNGFKDAHRADSSSDSSKGDKGFGHKRLPKNMARLWFLDANKKLGFKRVQIGITDGKTTEIKSGEGVEEGMEVITGILNAKSSANQPPRGFNMMMRGH